MFNVLFYVLHFLENCFRVSQVILRTVMRSIKRFGVPLSTNSFDTEKNSRQDQIFFNKATKCSLLRQEFALNQSGNQLVWFPKNKNIYKPVIFHRACEDI